ncbi:unnamed protein product [Trichobilharzia szidati]|nr:unnamed protein product [Trichobilharzia szidati]
MFWLRIDGLEPMSILFSRFLQSSWGFVPRCCCCEFENFMSTASKITLGVSCVFALSAFVGVHLAQALEREKLSETVRREIEREIQEAKNSVPYVCCCSFIF